MGFFVDLVIMYGTYVDEYIDNNDYKKFVTDNKIIAYLPNTKHSGEIFGDNWDKKFTFDEACDYIQKYNTPTYENNCVPYVIKCNIDDADKNKLPNNNGQWFVLKHSSSTW